MLNLPELNIKLDRLLLERTDLCYELIEVEGSQREKVERQLEILELKIETLEFEMEQFKSMYEEIHEQAQG